MAKADPNVPNADGVTPVIVASNRGHINMVKKLLFFGALINESAKKAFGITALGQASQQGHDQVVTPLIKANADVNQARTDGTTPLHDAARNNHLKVADALQAAGADHDALDDEGKRPMDYAPTNEMKALLARNKKLYMYKRAIKNKKTSKIKAAQSK